jgi:DNA-binding transcriptional regulator YiaG
MDGDTLRRARKSMALTQEQLADKLGVSVVTVNRWERGHNRPSNMAQEVITSLMQKESANAGKKKGRTKG